jgi:hypothetical protein
MTLYLVAACAWQGWGMRHPRIYLLKSYFNKIQLFLKQKVSNFFSFFTLTNQSQSSFFVDVFSPVVFRSNWKHLLRVISLQKLTVSWRGKIKEQNVKTCPGNTDWKGRLSTDDLLLVFVKRVNNVCNVKNSWSILVITRRSSALSLPLQ